MPPIRVADDEDAIPGGKADSDEPGLGPRVVGVGNGCSERISEDGGRLLKSDGMFRKVQLGLAGLPLEVHGWILPERRGLVCTLHSAAPRGFDMHQPDGSYGYGYGDEPKEEAAPASAAAKVALRG